MFNKNKNEINKQELNETIGLLKKILKLLYFVMIVAMIFIITLIAREWGVVKFILSLLKVISPLFIGFIIAWLFNPLVLKLKEKGLPRWCGTAIVYIILILFLVIFFKVFIPTIYEQINDLIKSIPDILDSVEKFIDNTLNNIDLDFDVEVVKENLFNTLSKYANSLTNDLPEKILNMVFSLISALGTIAFGLVVGLYMMLDYDSIKKQFVKYIPSKYRKETKILVNNIGNEVLMEHY